MSNSGLNLDSLLQQIPVGEIATRAGVDEPSALDAITKALPGLLGGLASNAQSETGANALEEALKEHVRDVPSLDEVDVNDGEKIIQHALGNKKKDVISAVSGGNDDLVGKIMPMLAPVVMAFLARNLFSGGTQQSSGGGVGDLLGSILGGSSGGGAGGILGSILGGGSGNTGGGGLGGILGSILGGNR